VRVYARSTAIAPRITTRREAGEQVAMVGDKRMSWLRPGPNATKWAVCLYVRASEKRLSESLDSPRGKLGWWPCTT
jgi:hypothetical protein